MTLSPTQKKEQDIANLGMDDTVTPMIPYRGMLYWTGSGWAKWSGNPGSEQTQNIDIASATVIYLGWAVAGTATSVGSWKIKKLTFSGSTIITQTFADGNVNYDNIWDNRASLSYS